MGEKLKPAEIPFWERKPGQEGWKETMAGVGRQLYTPVELFLKKRVRIEKKADGRQAVAALVKPLWSTFSAPYSTKTIIRRLVKPEFAFGEVTLPEPETNPLIGFRMEVIESLKELAVLKKELVTTDAGVADSPERLAQKQADQLCQKFLSRPSPDYDLQKPISIQNWPRNWRISPEQRYDLYLFAAFAGRVMEKMEKPEFFGRLGKERTKVAARDNLLGQLEGILFQPTPPLSQKEQALLTAQEEEGYKTDVDPRPRDRQGLRHLSKR